MKVISEIGLADFNAWSGAESTKAAILEADKGEDFDSMIEELHPNGLTDTQLNDILWHDSDWCFEMLGISEEKEEEEEEEEEEE